MMNMDDNFKSLAYEALRTSYYETQMFDLSFEYGSSRMIEYFITVNLCKELSKWNLLNGNMYKIQAEKNTDDFYDDCFDYGKVVGENYIFNQVLYPDDYKEFIVNKSSIRKGKIDIVLSRPSNGFKNISEYIIEVKSINPKKVKLKEDFIRIQLYLKNEIPNFNNYLKRGYIVFIKNINHKKVHFEKDLKELKQKFIESIENCFEEIKYKDIEFELHRQTIEFSPCEKLRLDTDIYDEIASKTFYTFSVVVEIYRLS